MGVLLPKPKTDKTSFDGPPCPESVIRYGLTAMQGWRRSMEDAHLAIPDFDDSVGIYGVFDGHGGPVVAHWVSRHLAEELREKMKKMRLVLERLAQNSELIEDSASLDQRSYNFSASDCLASDWRLAGLKNEERLSPSGLPFQVVVLCESLQATFMHLDTLLREEKHILEVEEIHNELSASRDPEDLVRAPNVFEEYLMRLRSARPSPVIRIVQRGSSHCFQFVKPEADDDGIEDIGGDTERGQPLDIENKLDDDGGDGDGGNKRSEDGELFSLPYATNDNCLTVDMEKAEDNVDWNGNNLRVFEGQSHDSILDNDDGVQEGFTTGGGTNGHISVYKADETVDNTGNANTGTETVVVSEVGKVSTVACTGGNAIIATNADTGAGTDTDVQTVTPNRAATCGTTAIIVTTCILKHGPPLLVTVNAGDSRAVLCRGGEAVALSSDHKPDTEDERRRIKLAGGNIIDGRVDGNLNLSRTLGDLVYKSDQTIPQEDQKITSFPDTRVIPLTADDEFVVLACDGIWDCLSNQDLVDYVRARLNPSTQTHELTDHSADRCMSQTPATVASPGDASEDFGMDANESSSKGRGISTTTTTTPSAIENVKLSSICEELCDKCLASHPRESAGGIGCDNMTVMIIELGSIVQKCETMCNSEKLKLLTPKFASSSRQCLYTGRLYRALSLDKEHLEHAKLNDVQLGTISSAAECGFIC